jgi:hypothetical protein
MSDELLDYEKKEKIIDLLEEWKKKKEDIKSEDNKLVLE